jgi:hypothetical protein
MKKILMLVMMVVTMGLVGCGEMTAEEMEKEIVSIAEENGYEMIIIKKEDKKDDKEEGDVEMSTFQLGIVEESTAIEEEENVDIEEPTLVLEVNEKYGIPTIWVEATVRAWEHADYDIATDTYGPTSYWINFTWDTADYGKGIYTKQLRITKEEYEVAIHCTAAKILIPAKSDGTPILIVSSAWEIYEYEFITE